MRFTILLGVFLILSQDTYSSFLTQNDVHECDQAISNFISKQKKLSQFCQKHKLDFTSYNKGFRTFRLTGGIDVSVKVQDLEELNVKVKNWYLNFDSKDQVITIANQPQQVKCPSGQEKLQMTMVKYFGRDCCDKFSDHKEALIVALLKTDLQPILFNKGSHTLNITEIMPEFNESQKQLVLNNLIDSSSSSIEFIKIRYLNLENTGQDYGVFWPYANICFHSETLLFKFKVVPTAQDF